MSHWRHWMVVWRYLRVSTFTPLETQSRERQAQKGQGTRFGDTGGTGKFNIVDAECIRDYFAGPDTGDVFTSRSGKSKKLI